jgi:hypothetical protein
MLHVSWLQIPEEVTAYFLRTAGVDCGGDPRM